MQSISESAQAGDGGRNKLNRLKMQVQHRHWYAPVTAILLNLSLSMAACSDTVETAYQPASQAATKQTSSSDSSTSYYTTGRSSYGGTGRFYMGREIANVMGYQGADWLERPEREVSERTDLVVDNLPVGSSGVIADIGAGSGYFSRRLATLVPDGAVLAVDIQPEMLAILKRIASEEGIDNITPILATENSLNLAPGSIDLALMVDAYHELARPREVMLELKEALKPGGKIVLVEYRAEDEAIPIIPVHKMTEQQARAEMDAIGLGFVVNLSMLPIQHFLVFGKSSELLGTTRAWDCAKSGAVVSNEDATTGDLWLFLPREAVLMSAGENGQYSGGLLEFKIAGNTAELTGAASDGKAESCTSTGERTGVADAVQRGTRFRAIGNEPPWILEIGAAQFVLKTGYEMEPNAFPAANPETNIADGSTRYFTRSENGSTLTVEVSAEPCNDSMSGEPFTNAVRVSFAGTTYRGCGSPLQ